MPSALLVEPDLTGSEPLSELAYRELRRLIVTLELAPGSPVSEAELSERLGLGRTPIREALRALAAERLIDVYPRRGRHGRAHHRLRARHPAGHLVHPPREEEP